MGIYIYRQTPQYEENINQAKKLHDINMELRNYYLEQTSYTFIYKQAKKEGYIAAPFLPMR